MTLSMILTHLALVVAALVFAILAGVPLGILCYFYPSARRVVLRVVDLIQTTPALALLGIIMVFMGAGKPTVIVGLALLALPVGAVYLGVRTLISGFASFAYLPDTLLLLGIGAVSTGVGLAVAWVVVWMAVTVLKALRRRILVRTGRLAVREGGPEI